MQAATFANSLFILIDATVFFRQTEVLPIFGDKLMEDVVIVDAARSAVGRKNGSLGLVHPTDTLGPVMMKMLERTGVSPSEVD